MPARHVIQTEALAYLAAHPASPGTSVVTSLPDVSEVTHLDLDGWRHWFVGAVRQVTSWVPEGGLAVFFQSDIRVAGGLVDKGYLVMRGAEGEATLLWHKIVCREPPGTISFGRPTYSHLLCFRRGPMQRPSGRSPGPDVVPDAGLMTWSRAMGVNACRVALEFVRNESTTSLVVDPFCGRGTVLAVANALGFDALGLDLGARRCQAARTMTVEGETPALAPVERARPPPSASDR